MNAQQFLQQQQMSVLGPNDGARIYVLAGRHEEALLWAVSHKIARRYYLFADDRNIRGIANPFYTIIGTFIYNEHAHDIIDALRPTNPIELHPHHIEMFQTLSDKLMLHCDHNGESYLKTPDRLKTFKTIL